MHLGLCSAKPEDGPNQFDKEFDVSRDCSYVSIARRYWKLCEHEFANTWMPTLVFEGCWPSAMVDNARPCALVTNRALGVDLSSGVWSRHTVILRSRCTKLLFFRDASCDSLDTHFPKF